MIEVHPSLFVGSETDEQQVRSQPGWRFVHACKDPYHRQVLGYSGRAAPKNHPEYLIARRPERLILNLVDVDDPAYVAVEIIDAAMAFIGESLGAGRKTLVHCNQGESRGPSIGLLYMAARTDRLPKTSLEAAEAEFRTLYTNYNPKPGIRGFLQIHWTEYMTRRTT
jgi:hypothetical protein